MCVCRCLCACVCVCTRTCVHACVRVHTHVCMCLSTDPILHFIINHHHYTRKAGWREGGGRDSPVGDVGPTATALHLVHPGVFGAVPVGDTRTHTHTSQNMSATHPTSHPQSQNLLLGIYQNTIQLHTYTSAHQLATA